MKAMTVLSLLAVFVVLFQLASAKCKELDIEAIEKEQKDFPNKLSCDRRCKKGGCLGKKGFCRNLCYCYGSGYEYRCIDKCLARPPEYLDM